MHAAPFRYAIPVPVCSLQLASLSLHFVPHCLEPIVAPEQCTLLHATHTFILVAAHNTFIRPALASQVNPYVTYEDFPS